MVRACGSESRTESVKECAKDWVYEMESAKVCETQYDWAKVYEKG